MKRLLRADLFAFGKTKSTYILPLTAVLLGALLPLMYFGIVKLFEGVLAMDLFAEGEMTETVAAINGLLVVLNGRTVFLSSLPMTQGFGLTLTAVVGFASARPFGTGIYRNKLIFGYGRGSVYASQLTVSYLLAMPSAFLYLGTTALVSRFCFGPLEVTGDEWLSILLLTLGLYFAYTAISVLVAFLARSVPLTLVITILLPLMLNMILSFLLPVLTSAPEWLKTVSMALPSVQSLSLTAAAEDRSLIAVALCADAVWALLSTGVGILRFRRADLK